MRFPFRFRPLWSVAALTGAAVIWMATDRDRFVAIARNMQIFAEVYRAVNSDYVEKTDPNRLMRTAIDSMLNSMDPYTNFFSEAQMERLRIDVRGAWDGVGVEIAKHQDKIIVTELVEGYPAEKEGIRVGDILLEIDGSVIKDQAVEEVEKTLNGKAGTQVTVKMRRPDTGQERTLTLTRQSVVKKNVPYAAMIDKNTAYIVLTTFTEMAAENIANALKELQEEHNPKQVILDLRENGGGLLIEAVNICNIFVGKGKDIVTTYSKIPEWDRSFKTLNNPVDTKIPLIILINEHSASASEIVAGAIQDFDRGLLVGRKSFGKGLVQNTKDIGYNSKMKLTTAKYYIPSGRCIQALEYRDGRALQISDSLQKVFKTANGRVVKDAGGLIPDVLIERPAESMILKNLREKRLIFDFANRYRQKNDSLPSQPADFEISDALFEEFVRFVNESKASDYETASEIQLRRLREQVKQEGSSPEIEATIERLNKAIAQEKRRDIYKFKQEIKNLLAEEIVSRYHYEKGRIQVRLRYDNDVREAVKLFGETERFRRLLEPPK